MVKKMLQMILALLLVVTPCCAHASEQVIDQIGLFSIDDIEAMNALINRIEAEHQVDIVVLATRDTPYDSSESMYRIRNYADDFYDQGGYGMGPDNSGMLILLDMHNRCMWLSTGGVMIEYINDMREEDILDHAYGYLGMGQYGTAMIAALQRTEQLMEKGRAEGTFLYDEATGDRLSGIYNALTSAETALAAVAGLAAGALVLGVATSSYNLKGSTYRYDLSGNSSLTLTQDEETYLRQSVSRTARHQSTGSHGSGDGMRSGGSGVHRSSGGVRHGGGGRRF